MPQGLTGADWAAIQATPGYSRADQNMLAAIYRAGLAAGNKEREKMQRVIDAAKAARKWMDGYSAFDKFDAALAKLEGDK